MDSSQDLLRQAVQAAGPSTLPLHQFDSVAEGIEGKDPADARQILEQIALRPMIDKTRHHVRRGGHLWEIDEFHGDNAGLIVAETAFLALLIIAGLSVLAPSAS